MISEQKRIMDSIKGILSKTKLLSLSTIGRNNKPASCSAYFAYDDKLRLYIWTDINSKHYKNLLKNSAVSVNIADTSQHWGSLLRGMQITAKAAKVTASELKHAGRVYLRRFSMASRFITKAEDFHSKEYSSRLVKIIPLRIKVLDERTFGKENFKEIKL